MKKSDINILVVEDDRSLGAVIVEAINREGYKAVHALRPEDAISFVKIKTFHAAVIDCMLPKTNGVALAEILRTQFLNSNEPIVLMSGIYKDRTFSQEAVRKVGAVEFLYKPFAATELIKIISKHLDSKISQPKVAIHSLLSTPFSSSRDRRKAIEQVDEIIGYDMPFILSVFLEDEFSGHLNLVNEAQEMYGITLNKSMITGVDSVDSVSSLSLFLVQKGFVSRDELNEISSREIKGDFLKALIDGGYISPHAAEHALNEYLSSELNQLICAEKFKISISPDRKMKPSETGMSLNDFTKMYWPLLQTRYPQDWFYQFYKEWLEHPIRKGPQHGEREVVLKLVGSNDLVSILEHLNSEPSLEDLLTKHKSDEIAVLRLLHCLCSRRIFVFDIEKNSTSWLDVKVRSEKLLKEIVNKDQEEVFVALGLPRPLRLTEVIKVYKEFAKGNHPDKIPESADPDLKKTVQKVFSIVSEAYQTLTDESRRETYKKSVQNKKLEAHLHAERLLDEIPRLVNLGNFSEAEEVARKANSILANDVSKICLALSLVKDKATTQELGEADRLLSEVTFDGRRDENYWLTSGRLSLYLNDYSTSAENFKKAVEINPQSLEARRGLMRIQAASGKGNGGVDFSRMSASEIMNADLGDLTKKFLKKHFG